jgi:hypothetical protein
VQSFRTCVVASKFQIAKLGPDGFPTSLPDCETLEDAKACVASFAEFWPGVYVIRDEATGERITITAQHQRSFGTRRPS